MLGMNFNFIIMSLLMLSVVYCQGNGTWLPTSSKQLAQVDQCPPWFFYNDTTKQCECYSNPSTHGIVKCTEQEALLKFGYCTTYEEGRGLSVGLCNYFKVDNHETTKDNFIRLPSNISELNDYMCGPLNRKGVMCSECIDGFGPSITSVGYTCSNCTNVWYGVPLYLFLEFVPITIFYFIVLFFRINVTSAPMVAFVFYSQIGVSTFLIMSNRYIFDTSLTYHFLNVLVTFYGIFNLDFFRYILPPFCVSPNIKAIHITFLYYISAFYPLCLIAISWICIQLYSRNFKPLVCLWSKLNGCFLKRISDKWDAKNTMTDAFATFFLLSYAKLVFTCFRTISYGITLNVNDFSSQQILHVKSDPSVGYFSNEHLPFAVASAFVFLIAILPLPLLLALYPFRPVRSLLFKCPFGSRSIAALNIFVEKFYSCYRDGLDGGRDMRGLVSIHFFLRLLGNYMSVDDILKNMSFTTVVVLYAVCSHLIAIAQPYKKTYMNTIETLIIANLALISLILDKYSGQEHSTPFTTFYLISGSMLSSLPLVVLIGFLIYKICERFGRRLLHCCYMNVKEDLEASQEVNLDSYGDSELPDRMLRPEKYHRELNSDQILLTSSIPKVYGSVA